jgi:hypothetical protein
MASRHRCEESEHRACLHTNTWAYEGYNRRYPKGRCIHHCIAGGQPDGCSCPWLPRVSNGYFATALDRVEGAHSIGRAAFRK